MSRACELDVQRPLYYALRFCRKLLGTAIPEDVLVEARIGAPPADARKIMDVLVTRAISPKHPDLSSAMDRVASQLLYIRSHYLRMPLHLLIPHLVRKAFMRRQYSEDEVAIEN